MNDNLTSITDFKIPVHRSLLQPDMLMGIGTNAATMLLVLTILCMQIVGLWFIFISVGIYFVLRILCKSDPYLLEQLLDNILEQDMYHG